MSPALIVIDVQNDFCPSGALSVDRGDEIVVGINSRMAAAEMVILTQDWHPAEHSSFASQHASKALYDVTRMPLWQPGPVAGSLRNR